MSARKRNAVWCPSCGSTSEEPAGPPPARGSLVCVPDLGQTADHDRTDAGDLRLMSA
jgi:hypothetical protein